MSGKLIASLSYLNPSLVLRKRFLGPLRQYRYPLSYRARRSATEIDQLITACQIGVGEQVSQEISARVQVVLPFELQIEIDSNDNIYAKFKGAFWVPVRMGFA